MIQIIITIVEKIDSLWELQVNLKYQQKPELQNLDISNLPVEINENLVLEEIEGGTGVIENIADITNEADAEVATINNPELGNHVTSKGVRVHIPSGTIKTNNGETLTMFNQILFYLKRLDKRVEKLESSLPKTDEENEHPVINFVPFTFEKLPEIDSLLQQNPEISVQFKKMISKIGGNSPKDNISRILGKIFPNDCAMLCSWKGLRNNFPVHQLQAITIMKEIVLKSFSYVTEKDLDNIITEWFRFAKQ